MRSTGRTAVVAGALAVALLVTGCRGGGGGGDDGAGAPRVAAEVNGTTISAERTEQLTASLAKGDALREEVETGEFDRRSVAQVALAYLIRLTYLEQVAEELGIDDAADPKEAEAISQLPPEAFSARGWGAGDLQAALRATRLSQAVAEKIFPTPGVAEAELRKVYEQDAEKFRNYWHAAARVAFFKDEAGAQQMKPRVAAGTAFADAAQALGAAEEGSLGEVTPDAPLGKPILDTIATLAPGGVSDPVPAGGGFFVITVQQRVDTPARTFEEVRADLLELQQNDRRRQLFYEWLGRQLAKAKIEVSTHYGRWDSESLEVVSS